MIVIVDSVCGSVPRFIIYAILNQLHTPLQLSRMSPNQVTLINVRLSYLILRPGTRVQGCSGGPFEDVLRNLSADTMSGLRRKMSVHDIPGNEIKNIRISKVYSLVLWRFVGKGCEDGSWMAVKSQDKGLR